MKIKLLILSFLFTHIALAQDFFTYKLSKPYCVLNFMNTATNRSGTSVTLKKYIAEKTANDGDFKKLCDDFTAINLHYNINRDEFPETRIQNSSTYNLLVMNAVNAKDLADFKVKCIGLLPLNANQKLFNILSQAEKVYDKIIWNEFEAKTKAQMAELAKFTSQNTEIFNTFAAFYQSSWTNDIPFQVAIYPIPGPKGNTSATPHINSLCVGVLTDSKNYNSTNGVVLHEMCHILFNEQSAEVQNAIDAYFKQNQSPYAQIAYSFFDEALATALGNGWAHKKITGKADETEWYNNVTINGFAKALFPSVETYLSQKKSIDKGFVDNAVSLFAAKFPNAIYDYNIRLDALVLYTDAEPNDNIRTALRNHFRISNFSVSSPILHPYSFESMNDTSLTQLFVIDKNHPETLAKLKDIFPEIGSYQYQNKTQNLSFIDKKGRAVILLLMNNLDDLMPMLQQMKDRQYLNPKEILQNQ